MIGFDNQWQDPLGMGRVVRTFTGAARLETNMFENSF